MSGMDPLLPYTEGHREWMGMLLRPPQLVILLPGYLDITTQRLIGAAVLDAGTLCVSTYMLSLTMYLGRQLNTGALGNGIEGEKGRMLPPVEQYRGQLGSLKLCKPRSSRLELTFS